MRWKLLLLPVLLAACKTESAMTSPAAFADSDWTLVELWGQPLELEAGGEPPTIRFDAGAGRASGSTGINRFQAGYELEGEALRFGPAASTKRAGTPAAMKLESDYLRALEAAESLAVGERGLALHGAGEVVARFEQR